MTFRMTPMPVNDFEADDSEEGDFKEGDGERRCAFRHMRRSRNRASLVGNGRDKPSRVETLRRY